MAENWIAYADERPTVAGVYQWRLQSKACEGLMLNVLAKMRMRGAGYESVLSPEFDYWDGYRVLVPKELWWRVPKEGAPEIAAEGVAFDLCPFCGRVPKLVGMECDGHAVTVNASPADYNDWHLECCRWTRTPRYDDPRGLAAARRLLLRGAK